MDISPITEFLGIEPDQEGLVEPDKFKRWFYQGEKLVYELNIDLDEKRVAVSGDLSYPFANNSLYEVYLHFDQFALETEPQFYGEQNILVFRKNYSGKNNAKVLMIMRWPNGELSVWPSPCDGKSA